MAHEDRSRPRTWVVVACAALVAAVYLLRLDHVAGLMVDDAWYVLLAKALAQGDGFRLISSAATQILPIVPPGFPAILALIFRLRPQFPENVLLLKSVSIAAMAGVGLLTYWHMVRRRSLPWEIAIGISIATLVTPGLVFLATSTVMAECVFMLGQLTTVVVVERMCVGGRLPARRATLLAAVLAGATTLVRSTGWALIAAVVVYLLYQRFWRRALLFTAATLVCLTPWTLYARAHAPTTAQRMEHGGSIAFAYTDSMQMRAAATPQLGRATWQDLRGRVTENLRNVFARDVGGILVPTFFRGAEESGEEVVSLGGKFGLQSGSMGNATATIAISLVLSAIAFVGYIRASRERLGVPEVLVPMTIAMIVIVPFWTYRYVLPLTPFIFQYLLEGIRVAISRVERRTSAAQVDRWRVARLVIFCLLGLDVYDHAQYILDARETGRTEWVADAREVDDVLGWMRANLQQPAPVATTNPALVYLDAGRKAVAIDDFRNKWSKWKMSGIRYLVALRPAELPDSSCGPYKILYLSARRKLWVIEI